MKNDYSKLTDLQKANYYIYQTIKTRNYGHTYVHVDMRDSYVHMDVVFTPVGFGRSLQAGGHKWRMTARATNGKTVPTKDLELLFRSEFPRIS